MLCSCPETTASWVQSSFPEDGCCLLADGPRPRQPLTASAAPAVAEVNSGMCARTDGRQGLGGRDPPAQERRTGRCRRTQGPGGGKGALRTPGPRPAAAGPPPSSSPLPACLVGAVVSFIIPCPDRMASQGVWRIDYNAAGVGGRVPWRLKREWPSGWWVGSGKERGLLLS